MVANSTTILPLRLPISTLTRVSKTSDSRSASRRSAGAAGGRAAGERRAGLLGLDTHRDDLLDRPYAEPFRDDPLGQPRLGAAVGQPEQGTGMPRGQHAGCNPVLHVRRQLEQAQGIGDMRPGPAEPTGQLLVGGPEVIEKLLVSRGLLERVELLPVQVLQQRVAEHVVVLRAADDRRDVREPGLLARPPAPFAHDDLEVPRHDRPDDYGLEQADDPNRLGEFFQRLGVEYLAGLTRVRGYRADGDLVEVRVGAYGPSRPAGGRTGCSIARCPRPSSGSVLGQGDSHIRGWPSRDKCP